MWQSSSVREEYCGAGRELPSGKQNAVSAIACVFETGNLQAQNFCVVCGMNIPVGEIESQAAFSAVEPFGKLSSLLQSDFSGYLVATIEGTSGLEEGLLVLKGREIVGAVFDALRLNKQLYGVPALKLVFNLLRAGKGLFDVDRLSKQQIDLILAFNEKIKLPKPIDSVMLSKLQPKEFRPELVLQEFAMQLDSTESKSSLLKKLGLGSI